MWCLLTRRICYRTGIAVFSTIAYSWACGGGRARPDTRRPPAAAQLLHSRPVGEVGLRTADIGPVLAQGCSHVHYLWFIRRGRKAEAMSEALAR